MKNTIKKSLKLLKEFFESADLEIDEDRNESNYKAA
mgnify:CR=1 FL=1